jgi:hypothetical protein
VYKLYKRTRWLLQGRQRKGNKEELIMKWLATTKFQMLITLYVSWIIYGGHKDLIISFSPTYKAEKWKIK